MTWRHTIQQISNGSWWKWRNEGDESVASMIKTSLGIELTSLAVAAELDAGWVAWWIG